MAVRRLAPKELQPKDFAFTPENEVWSARTASRNIPEAAGLGGDPAAVDGAGAGRRLGAGSAIR